SLHSLRDIALGVRPLATVDAVQIRRIRMAALWHSYLPLWIGVLGFLILITIFVIYLAINVDAKIQARFFDVYRVQDLQAAMRAHIGPDTDSEFQKLQKQEADIMLEIRVIKSHRALAIVGAFFPVFGLIGFAIGGALDICKMCQTIYGSGTSGP